MAIVSTLTKARCRTETGASERQLYRIVCAFKQHVAERKEHAGASMANLSSVYRIWRQVLEDKMHQAVLLWHEHSIEHSLHARHVWPSLALSDHIWATMAAALLSVMGSHMHRTVHAWVERLQAQKHKQPDVQHEDGSHQVWLCFSSA